jgi:hypothetical protein
MESVESQQSTFEVVNPHQHIPVDVRSRLMAAFAAYGNTAAVAAHKSDCGFMVKDYASRTGPEAMEVCCAEDSIM